MFTNWKLGTKIGAGYFLVTLVLAASVVFTLVQIARMDGVVHSLIGRHAPTFEACLRMLNGIHKSSAKLRGYVLVKEEALKKDRADALALEADKALEELRKLIKEFGTTEQRKLVEAIEKDYGEFKKAQQEIEDIAHTEKSIPVNHAFSTQLEPKGNQLMEVVAAMIDEEAAIPPTPERRPTGPANPPPSRPTGNALVRASGWRRPAST
jgi:methyl-accepting chemotaxis protein